MSDDPFAALGLAPTTDLDALKRGYFKALKLHPPHADPEGFRRVRAAYEALSKPGALASAWLAAGAAPDADLAALDDAWAAPLASSRAESARGSEGAATRARFARWISARAWDELRRG